MPEDIAHLHDRNSDEITELISAPPSWILRSGIMVIFITIAGIIALSAFIAYPDVVKTSLKINSINAPKLIITKQAGKLVRILVKEGQPVKEKEPLAFLESTASHADVIRLSGKLLLMRDEINAGKAFAKPEDGNNGLNLGELQSAYQSFHQSYIQFMNTRSGGNTLLQRSYLLKDLMSIQRSRKQILAQQELQKQEFGNAEEEYKAYTKLVDKGVISRMEFKQQQSKYLSSKAPLQQTEAALLSNEVSYLAKQKELSDLGNTISEQQMQFVQALNSMINETQSWLQRYVLSTPVNGTVAFAGILQENQNVAAGQELFIISPSNTRFFGEVQIPQYNMGKIREGQRTLVKLKSYPFEEYGLIRGKVGYLSDVAYKDSVFVAKIDFEQIESKDTDRKIVLKNGMMADAEIVTEESSLLQRFLKNIRKMFNTG